VSPSCYVLGTATGLLMRMNCSRARFSDQLCGGASATNMVAHQNGVVALVAWPEMGIVFSAGLNDCRLCAWDAEDLFRTRVVAEPDPDPIWEWRAPSSLDRLELVPITGSVQEKEEVDESWIEDLRSMCLVATSADGRRVHTIELADGEDVSSWKHLSSMPLSRPTSAVHVFPPRTILYPKD
jgi:hypothetical protein